MRRSYRLAFFLLSALLALVGLLVLRVFGRYPRWQNAIYRAWRSGFLWAMGIQIKSTGEAFNRPALLVSNHRSYADVLFVESHLPVVFLSKAEVRSWPLVGWAARALDTKTAKRNIFRIECRKLGYRNRFNLGTIRPFKRYRLAGRKWAK
jgi:1-acyl-sn-glycerol-3-phosphate acyltransferase